MAKKYTDRLKSALHIATAVAAAAAGACLMAACWGIYRGGEGFSRKAVADAFTPISLPVYLCLGLVLAGWLAALFLPDGKKNPSSRQVSYALQRIKKTRDLSICGPTLKKDILAQRKARLLHKGIAALLTAAGSVVFLCFALQPDAFHQIQINESVIQAMVILLPCMTIPFGYGVFAQYFCRQSMEKEIALLKIAPRKQDVQSTPSPASRFNGLLAARLVLTCAAVALLVYGLATGGIADVLTKAINICTECVGLG